MTVSMPPPVEATSLESVKIIASHPPPRPDASFRSLSSPLVLYIARVPGSRDVFLTPMKPREKVVTAEDVQSSLYYVHVNSTADYELEADSASNNSWQTNARNIPPLPERPSPNRPALPARPPTTAHSFQSSVRDDTPKPTLPPRVKSISRKPVSSGRIDSTTSSKATLGLPTLPSRPLPALPAEHQASNSLHNDNVRLLRHLDHDTNNNPYIRDYDTHPETLKQLERDARPEPETLTLIRRDPSSSDQWNVASIHDPPVPEISSSSLSGVTSARRVKKGGSPLYLDILNPNYSQFVDETRTGSLLSVASTSSSENAPPLNEPIFRRRLYMPGSRYGEHGYGSRTSKNLSVSSLESSSIDPHERQSVDLTGNAMAPPRADRRGKGYTFLSPWGGQCDFTTGAAGKSLKCRHTLPNGGPLVEVSELRFNLPSSIKARRNTMVADGSGNRASSYISKHMHRFSSEDGSASPTVIIDEETGRIDLTLGQERAGGGFGGKQAKLGKLIIEPEGYKMLDLLVAANVGLWWRAYERGS